MSAMDLLAECLWMAANEFAEHGCNDFDVSPWLTLEEQIKFVTVAHELNGDPEETAGSIANLPYIPDFVVMGTLASMIKNRRHDL